MCQWLALDRHSRGAYYAGALLGLAATACGSVPASLAPERLPVITRAEVSRWVEEYIPDRAQRYDLRWTFQTQQGRARGRAAVVFVPPDSLRFDYRGPFGRSGAAVLVGGHVAWSEPEQEVEQLIPVTPLFWAALGVPGYPGPTTAIRGRAAGARRVWQYTAGLDTLTYAAVRTPRRTLSAELRQAGRVIGTAEVTFADRALEPSSAQVLFPNSASVIFFTVEAIEPLTAVDPDIWKRP